jgi:hypothetical protein
MKTKQPLPRKARDHVEDLLDEALAQTFPASDPIAVSPPARRDGAKRGLSLISARVTRA